jgi:NIMA (never in mitosis gene a)-related kinase 1/4/5
MEYANNGDLFQKITKHQREQTYLREDDIWRIFIQVVKGLKSLHDVDIFHRDLKSANVFLNKDGSTKLGDMNVSKVAKKGLLYTQTGTPYYASPEVWRDQPYDMKSDIWSLGCVLYESITLRPPFRADDMAGLYRKVLRGVYSRIPEHFSADLAEVTKSLIQVQAQLRPTCEQILSHPAVVRMGEQLFMDDFYDDMEDSPKNNELLSTIRVPKNLLYLTDRLPKPSYAINEPVRNRSTEEETKKRRTQEPSDH